MSSEEDLQDKTDQAPVPAMQRVPDPDRRAEQEEHDPGSPEMLSSLELGLDDLVAERMHSLMAGDADRASPGAPGEADAQGSGVLARPLLGGRPSTDELERSGSGAVLVSAGPGASGRCFELGETTLVGRSPRCQVQVTSAAVSLEHARIDREDDRHWLRDLGSTNGTRANGKRVEGPVELSNGDELVFGDATLIFLAHGAASGVVHTAQLGPTRGELQRWSTPPRMTAADAVPGPSFAEQLEKAFLVLRFLQRRWRMLTLLTVLGGLLGYATVLLKPPATVAEFEIAITPAPPENPLESQRYLPPAQRYEQQFFAQAQRSFVNPKLVLSTLQQLGEQEPAADRVVSIAHRLQLTQQPDSTHIGQFSDGDATWAIAFLTKHLDNFVRTEIERTVRELQNEVGFLSNAVKERDDELRRTEGERRDFMRQHMLHLPEYADGRLAATAQLEGQRANASTRVARLTAELELAKQRFARESPLLESKVAEAQPYRESLTDVNRRIADAKARGLSERHPEVQQLRREYGELERRAEQTARSPASDLDRQANPQYTLLKDRIADIEVELAAARKELGEVGGQLGRIDETVKAMPEAEATYARLTRSYDTDRALHGRLLEQLRRSEVQLELERSSARGRYEVITAPHSLGINLRKTIGTRAGAGLALGFLIALALAASRELKTYLRRRPLVRVSPSGRVVQVIAPSEDHPALPGP